MFCISLENRWYQGCYGGMKIMCFYFLIIDLKVSLKLKMFFTNYACSSEQCV